MEDVYEREANFYDFLGGGSWNLCLSTIQLSHNPVLNSPPANHANIIPIRNPYAAAISNSDADG
jgi:hypothetical protein